MSEYTNGQRVEFRETCDDEFVEGVYIGCDWDRFGDPYDAHVVLPLGSDDDYMIVADDNIRVHIEPRAERIERAIEDAAAMLYAEGLGYMSQALDAHPIRAALYAAIDSVVPE